MSDAKGATRQWIERWRRTATALAEVRARELAALSDQDALAAANDLLSLRPVGNLPLRRREWSGLVDWQRALHRGRR